MSIKTDLIEENLLRRHCDTVIKRLDGIYGSSRFHEVSKYFHFLVLLTNQRAALSYVTQHRNITGTVIC